MRRPDHRPPRHPDRTGLRPILLWLWSVNGDPVARFQAWVSGDSLVSSHCVHGSIRYDRVAGQSERAKIVHYQTRTIVPRGPVRPHFATVMAPVVSEITARYRLGHDSMAP